MGSYIGGSIGEAMGKRQMAMRSQMQRQMMSQKIAFTREISKWYGGFYAFYCLALTGYAIKHKTIPKVAIFPLVAMGTALAYQLDMAYGNKINRVYSSKLDILEDPKYFFNPNYEGDLPPLGETRQSDAEKNKEEQL